MRLLSFQVFTLDSCAARLHAMYPTRLTDLV